MDTICTDEERKVINAQAQALGLQAVDCNTWELKYQHPSGVFVIIEQDWWMKAYVGAVEYERIPLNHERAHTLCERIPGGFDAVKTFTDLVIYNLTILQ